MKKYSYSASFNHDIESFRNKEGIFVPCSLQDNVSKINSSEFFDISNGNFSYITIKETNYVMVWNNHDNNKCNNYIPDVLENTVKGPVLLIAKNGDTIDINDPFALCNEVYRIFLKLRDVSRQKKKVPHKQ